MYPKDQNGGNTSSTTGDRAQKSDYFVGQRGSELEKAGVRRVAAAKIIH